MHGSLPVSREREVTAADVGRYHLTGIETLWRFRFFFRDVNELFSRDSLLAESFGDQSGADHDEHEDPRDEQQDEPYQVLVIAKTFDHGPLRSARPHG